MSEIKISYKPSNSNYDNFNSSVTPNIPVKKNELTTKTNSLLDVEKITIEDNPERWYGKDWVVMQNRLIYAVSHLTLDERRVFLWLTANSRSAAGYLAALFSARWRRSSFGSAISGR